MAEKRQLKLPRVEIGILGGTGLYEIEGIKGLKEFKLKTPFGDPSDAYIMGTLEGKRVAFLSRHGRGHRHLPSGINYRANIYGLNRNCIVTDPTLIPAATKRKLGWIIKKYVK